MERGGGEGGRRIAQNTQKIVQGGNGTLCA